MAILTEAIIPLETTFESYRVQLDALSHYLALVLSSTDRGVEATNPLFEGMTVEEVYDAFDLYIREAGYSSMLAMLSSVEAFIRVDFKEKRRRVGRFRALYSEHGVKTALDEILDAWSNLGVSNNRWVSKYRDLLRLRHWLAHGRY